MNAKSSGKLEGLVVLELEELNATIRTIQQRIERRDDRGLHSPILRKALSKLKKERNRLEEIKKRGL